MAKLIGHMFNAVTKKFVTFEVDGLKETPKQYTMTSKTKCIFSRHDWHVLRKSELGKLREYFYGFNSIRSFTMYDTAENMECFREKVVAVLEKEYVFVKARYDILLDMYEAAKV